MSIDTFRKWIELSTAGQSCENTVIWSLNLQFIILISTGTEMVILGKKDLGQISFKFEIIIKNEF